MQGVLTCFWHLASSKLFFCMQPVRTRVSAKQSSPTLNWDTIMHTLDSTCSWMTWGIEIYVVFQFALDAWINRAHEN